MGDREYLYELALILESSSRDPRVVEHDNEVPHIRIQAATAQDIATRLRLIANRLVH